MKSFSDQFVGCFRAHLQYLSMLHVFSDQVRGYCVDKSNPEVFDFVDVYGDIINSDIHHNCESESPLILRLSVLTSVIGVFFLRHSIAGGWPLAARRTLKIIDDCRDFARRSKQPLRMSMLLFTPIDPETRRFRHFLRYYFVVTTFSLQILIATPTRCRQ